MHLPLGYQPDSHLTTARSSLNPQRLLSAPSPCCCWSGEDHLAITLFSVLTILVFLWNQTLSITPFFILGVYVLLFLVLIFLIFHLGFCVHLLGLPDSVAYSTELNFHIDLEAKDLRIKVSGGEASSEAFLLGSYVATFFQCPHLVILLCVCVPIFSSYGDTSHIGPHLPPCLTLITSV